MKKSVPLNSLMVFVALCSLVPWVRSQEVTCEEAVKRFEGFACEQSEPIGKGTSAVAFLVKKEKFTRVLRVVKATTEAEHKKAEKEVELFQLFLGHRNIIRFIEHHRDEGHHYELMEHGTLGTVDNFQTTHPDYFKDHKRLTAFFRKVVKGVQFIHSKGYIHADMKPQNIVVTDLFEPKIIDFNLAIPKGGVSTYRGTLGYADPSFFIDLTPLTELEFDEYNDVYSLGVILYELTHGPGKLPFDGHYEADIVISLKRHRFKIQKGTHIHLARIIHSCLVISKKWRLSVDELLKQIDLADRIPENERLTEDLYLYNDEGLPGWMKPIKQKKFSRKRFYSYVLMVFLILVIVSMMAYIMRLGKMRQIADQIDSEKFEAGF